MSTAQPADQYVQVDGVNTRYWALGETGSPVALLHGLGGFIENWARNVHALAERHRVYALDLAGFGRSGKPEAPYSVPYLARFLGQFMDALEIERAALCGNSMGGGVALRFALLFPERVDRLVLVASAGLGNEVTLTLRIATLPIVGELLTRPSRKGAEQLLKEILHDPSLITDELIEISYQMASEPNAQGPFLKTLRSMGNFLGARSSFIDPIRDNLSQIAAPTLVVWGKQDRVLPVAHAHVAAESIPNAQLHVYDACGHVPQIERAEEFNALVLDFLGQN